MTRTRWILATIVVIIAATITTLLVVTTREPPPPDPFALTPDGRYQVPDSRTTDGVDPCSLLTTQDVRTAFDQQRLFISRDDLAPEMCFYTGNDGSISVYTDATFDSLIGGDSSFTATTLGGRPALVYASTGEVDCDVIVVVDSEPGQPGLRISATNVNTCTIPLGLAEIAVSRLPAGP
jgi:hypothetical protein